MKGQSVCPFPNGKGSEGNILVLSRQIAVIR